MVTDCAGSAKKQAGSSGERGGKGDKELMSVCALEFVGALDGLDAVVLVDTSALEPSLLLLLLTPQHSLRLYCGALPLCDLVLSGGGAGVAIAAPGPGEVRTIVGLSHAVAARTNVRYDDGSVVRVHVTSVSSLLVRRALLQVKNNVGASLYWHVRRRLLAFGAGMCVLYDRP